MVMTNFSFSRKLVGVLLAEPNLIHNSIASSLTTLPDYPHPCILPHLPDLAWLQHLGPNPCLSMLSALNRLVLGTHLPTSPTIGHAPHPARWTSTLQVWRWKHPLQKTSLLSLPDFIPLSSKPFLIYSSNLPTTLSCTMLFCPYQT